MEKSKTENKAEAENIYLIKFKKPISFEGKDYAEIDLSGLEDMGATELINTQKLFKKAQGNDIAPTDATAPESNVEYGFYIASKVTGLPMEFFYSLSAKNANKVKTAVLIFFNIED